MWALRRRRVPEALHALHAAVVRAGPQGDQAGEGHPEEVSEAARGEEETGGGGEEFAVAESEHDGEKSGELRGSHRLLLCLLTRFGTKTDSMSRFKTCRIGTCVVGGHTRRMTRKGTPYWTRFARQVRSLMKKNFYVLTNSKAALLCMILLPRGSSNDG